MCHSGPYVGSWVIGPTETIIQSAIDLAAHESDEELYSWAWEFQPLEAEYGLPPALSRKEALARVREWNVEWVDRGLAELARAMLFDDNGYHRRRRLFGLIRTTVLEPIYEARVVSYPHPLKLQSVRSVVTFKQQAEALFPPLRECAPDRWSRAAADLLRGDFVEVSRRGWFAVDWDSHARGGDRDESRRVAITNLGVDPVTRAKQLEETETCVGFVPRGVSVVNDPEPVSAWDWLRDLQRWSAEHG